MDPELMTQMQDMMNSSSSSKSKKSTNRLSKRFVDPATYANPRNVSQNLEGPYVGPMRATYGVDELQKSMRDKKKSFKKLDIDDWQEKHLTRTSYDPNFSPIHEILSHPNWSDSEKQIALNITLTYEPDLNKSIGVPPETPLQRAMRINNSEFLSTLLDAGANPNIMTVNGENSLMYAVRHGKSHLIPTLLKHGAKVRPLSNGLSLKDSAIEHFLISDNKVELFNTLIKLKQYKLYDGEDFLTENDKKILLQKFINDKKDDELKISTEQFNKMLTSLNLLKNDKVIKPFPPVRPYTNEQHRLENNHIGSYIKHPWFDSLTLFYDLQQRGDDSERKHKIEMGSIVVNKMISDPKYLIDIRKNWINEKRNELDLDYVLPNGECLLTQALKDDNIDLFKYAVELDVNLNVKDPNGDSVLHILTNKIKDVPESDFLNKRKYFELITAVVGLPDKEGRKSMYPHNNYGDWFITNSKGSTFLEELNKTHPQWCSELQKHLGIPDVNVEEPTYLEVLSLPYDSKLNKKPEDIKIYEPLSSIVSLDERKERIQNLGNEIIKSYQYLNDLTDETSKLEIYKRIVNNLNNADSDIKVGLLMGFTGSLSSDNDNSIIQKALEGVVSNLANDMNDPQKQKNIFESFDQVLVYMDNKNSLENIKNLVTQTGILTSNESLILLGNKIESKLSEIAKQKYGVDNEQEQSNQNNHSNR